MIDTPPAQIKDHFWAEIDHQLTRICRDKPQSFAALTAILHDPAYTEIVAYINQNGRRRFADNEAFFAGTGGDDEIIEALEEAGWRVTEVTDPGIHETYRSPAGERVEYLEGDLILRP